MILPWNEPALTEKKKNNKQTQTQNQNKQPKNHQKNPIARHNWNNGINCWVEYTLGPGFFV